MNVPLTTVLEELRADHVNIESLLNLLAERVAQIGAGGEPDFETLERIMHYMLVYADAVHHPREDLVYEAMREFSSELAAGLETVESDHLEIGQLGKALHFDIQAVIAGRMLRRDHIVKDATDYVRRLRNHMAWEEGDLFRRADKLAAQSGDVHIDLSELNATDPVFGASPEPAFSTLSARLTPISGAD